MYKKQINQIIKEFKNFTIPHEGYCGGRHQTTIKGFYAHISMGSGKPKLAKIEIEKDGGSRYFIKI